MLVFFKDELACLALTCVDIYFFGLHKKMECGSFIILVTSTVSLNKPLFITITISDTYK